MSSTGQQEHLEVEVLSEDARKMLKECGRQLETAPFKDNGKFEFINSRAFLREASRDFRKMQPKVSVYVPFLIEVINFEKQACLLIA